MSVRGKLNPASHLYEKSSIFLSLARRLTSLKPAVPGASGSRGKQQISFLKNFDVVKMEQKTAGGLRQTVVSR
ncbi:hypothetical protein EYF80_029210 [Liparis tanakae]|uniref:Uncharacterized protein n=1 Tax=Liparis tanakae TaxID=230148 RepID=A0A4Z2H4C6_9TELE|nr:hypothetical protein EYF80_029210 [Liparis tanakae]